MDKHNREPGIESVTLQIEGMDCTCNADLIRRKMNALAGVKAHEINPVTGQAQVSFDPATVSVQEIIRSVAETGMKASLVRGGSRRSTWWREPQQLALYGCGLIALVAFISGYFGVPFLVTNGLFLLSVLVGVYYPARKALVALVNLTPTIHLLMLIGSVGAMLLGLWGEAAVLIFVYSLGDVLESYAVDKARGAIRSLMELVPKEALVRRDDRETVCPVEEIAVGEVVVVRPGERVPVDGRVARGSSFVDQAAVTGEPVPVRREPGDDVFAGTINQNGVLEVTVEKPASETMLSRIICSVEEGQAKKTSFQRFSDSFGTYYTPAMFVLGALVATVPPLFFGAEWAPFIYRGLVVFVVSCSCGLALSVPVAVVAAMANAARHGTVFKGGAYLEAVDRLKAVAFDKTGTLTIGRPEVTDVLGFFGIKEHEVLELAASIESRSGHPLATAIVRKAKESGTYSGQPVEDVRETAGLGITATVGGRSCVVGSPRYQQESGVPVDDVGGEAIARFENDGKTVVMVSADSKLIGLLAIADNVRPGAVDALQRLHRAGIQTVMLTGDNERCARSIANQVGVDEYYAQLLPTDKVDVIQRLREKHGPVAMVGDGINDAPAMAVSDVGIAMGAAGTDIAIETGDIVLMSDDISKIAYVRELSRKAISTIRQNIAISLINIAFMVIAALLGYLGLVSGLLLNEASALFVIANALRLLKWKSKADAGISLVAGATVPDHDEPEGRIQLTTVPPATGGSCCAGAEPTIGVSKQTPIINLATMSCCSVMAQPAEASASTSVIDATEGSSCCSCEAQPTEEQAQVPEVSGANVPGGVEIGTFQIAGLCSCEGQIVEKRVKSLRGIAAFSLNAITNQMKVTYDPSIVSIPDIETAVKKAGGTAIPVKSK